MLNVDTRAHDDVVGTLRSDDISATPLEKLIHTKYAISRHLVMNGQSSMNCEHIGSNE